MKRVPRVVLLCLLSGASAAPAFGQVPGQIWTNLTYDWLSSERLSYQFDIEPKGQLVPGNGPSRWGNIDVTPSVEYAVNGWLDLVGELVTGYTDDSDDTGTLELTTRLGGHFHLLSRIIQSHLARAGVEREKRPLRRAVFGSLVRLEQRNQFHAARTSTSSWRLRDRFEFQYPITRTRMTTDGVVYLGTDAELFVPIGETTPGGLVNQVRVRSGVGYRASFAWRFEALYMWTGVRDPASGAFVPDSHALDLRLKRVF